MAGRGPFIRSRLWTWKRLEIKTHACVSICRVLTLCLSALTLPRSLSQVSNWFANARRRLKNTVRQPDLSWALRIKLYNKYVQGNAERLSVSSDDSCSEGRAALFLTSQL